MKLSELTITTELIDKTELTPEEAAVAEKIFAVYTPVFGNLALAYPPMGVTKAGIGVALRVVKGNLLRSIQIADLADIEQLKIPGVK